MNIKNQKSKIKNPPRKGFTLVELLVVVSIIVLLIAILLPALGRARNAAYNTKSTTVISNVQTAIESYYHSFQAYPGPASANDTAGTSKKLSGSQNLLLGLSYAMTSSSAAPAVSLPFASGLYADPTKPNGPINAGNLRPDGSAEQLPPFFDANSKTISQGTSATVWPATGVTGGLGSSYLAFPVLVDAFPDALPILYYRRYPSKDTDVVAQTYSASSKAAYYLDENKAYTDSTKLKGTGGSTYDQTKDAGSFYSGNPSALSNFQNAAMGAGASTARGGYVLIGAGVDRTYGKVNGATDDIVLVGGN